MLIVNIKRNIDLRTIHKYRFMLDVSRLKEKQCILLINSKENKGRLIDCNKNCYNIYLDPGHIFSVNELSSALKSGFGVSVNVKNLKQANKGKKRAIA